MSAVSYAELSESLREPGKTDLSPVAVAEVLGLQQQELAQLAGVHRNTMRLHPESPRVQALLRNLARVLTAMTQIQPDVTTAVYHIKNTPIPAFEFRTLFELIVAGRTDDVLAYVRSVSSGAAG
ncbi:DNA-binding protein [Xanthomonas arboricola]|uniref:DNA-binding protein n=1 Tax=Xanthomonas arboricola TaxID=56448 RepID=UPI000CEF0CD9|nr:DNA-binding protein [Xanthomonas arboricola]PPT49353.1 DNA-binding protein [Xanthomonas arboricola]